MALPYHRPVFMSIKTQPCTTLEKPSHSSHDVLTFDLHFFMMRTSWLLFVFAFCTTSYSQGTQQMLGSLDLLGNSYKCENGKPACFEYHTEKLIKAINVKLTFECTDSSAQPSCDGACTCFNGLPLSAARARSQKFPDCAIDTDRPNDR